MPCGFCGHDEARVIVVDEVTDAGCEEATVPLYAASCPYCGARGPMALSEGEAVDAWNRRAGRTCRVVAMDAAGSPPYRTGDWIYNELSDGCSECGYPFDTPNRGVPVYCAHCGAKVVE